MIAYHHYFSFPLFFYPLYIIYFSKKKKKRNSLSLISFHKQFSNFSIKVCKASQFRKLMTSQIFTAREIFIRTHIYTHLCYEIREIFIV